MENTQRRWYINYFGNLSSQLDISVCTRNFVVNSIFQFVFENLLSLENRVWTGELVSNRVNSIFQLPLENRVCHSRTGFTENRLRTDSKFVDGLVAIVYELLYIDMNLICQIIDIQSTNH